MALIGKYQWCTLPDLSGAATLIDTGLANLKVLRLRSDYRLLNTFGYLAIELPVICKVDGEQDVSEYMHQIQSQAIESMGHEVFPIMEMVQKYPDMFDYLFIYQGEEKNVYMDGKNVEVTWLSDNIGNGLIKLALQIFDFGDSYQISIDYHANRYSREWIEKMADMIEKIAKQALKATKLKEIDAGF